MPGRGDGGWQVSDVSTGLLKAFVTGAQIASKVLPGKYRRAAEAAALGLDAIAQAVSGGAKPEDFHVTRIKDIGPYLAEAKAKRNLVQEKK